MYTSTPETWGSTRWGSKNFGRYKSQTGSVASWLKCPRRWVVKQTCSGWQVIQWALFLAQRSALFLLAAASAQGAKAAAWHKSRSCHLSDVGKEVSETPSCDQANELKRSGIYLNQLMAFATISTTILTGVLQTRTAQQMMTTAKDMKSQAVTWLAVRLACMLGCCRSMPGQEAR